MYNRKDCCSTRLNNFRITVGNNDGDGKDNAVCVLDGGDVGGQEKITSYCDPPLWGRYLHVKLMGEATLTLCEVQVVAAKGE